MRPGGGSRGRPGVAQRRRQPFPGRRSGCFRAVLRRRRLVAARPRCLAIPAFRFIAGFEGGRTVLDVGEELTPPRPELESEELRVVAGGGGLPRPLIARCPQMRNHRSFVAGKEASDNVHRCDHRDRETSRRCLRIRHGSFASARMARRCRPRGEARRGSRRGGNASGRDASHRSARAEHDRRDRGARPSASLCRSQP
jgi:hypothetical protein